MPGRSNQFGLFRRDYFGSCAIFYLVPAAVRDYFKWQRQHRPAEFIPSADDDVDLRTYLLYLRANWAAPEEQVTVLERFYHWAQTKGVITHNPFDEHNFAHPLLTSAQINQRQQTLLVDRNEREVGRLRALSQIA